MKMRNKDGREKLPKMKFFQQRQVQCSNCDAGEAVGKSHRKIGSIFNDVMRRRRRRRCFCQQLGNS